MNCLVEYLSLWPAHFSRNSYFVPTCKGYLSRVTFERLEPVCMKHKDASEKSRIRSVRIRVNLLELREQLMMAYVIKLGLSSL